MKKVIFGVFISALLIACNEKTEEKTGSIEAPVSSNDKKSGVDEMLPLSEADGVKNGFIAFSKGDIDGMTAEYADTARQLWSNLDSLVGKKAIQDYYRSRWTLIDSLTFSEFVLVPMKANVQQSQYAPVGKWVLAWALAHVKYKNGKKIDFWLHNDYHYNDAGKVDFVVQYIDMHPIREATK